MSRRRAAACSALLAILLTTSGACRSRARPEAPAGGEPLPATDIAAPSESAVTLFFPGGDGRLHAEPRELPEDSAGEDRLAFALQELLAGPTGPGLAPVLPAGTGLAGARLAPGGIAYVDLQPAAGAPRPAWGSRQEMLAVYSLVNTVIVNVPETRGVVLLWNGRQQTTFAGHIDTTRPLGADRSLVAPERAG